jgi:hypothetical protein
VLEVNFILNTMMRSKTVPVQRKQRNELIGVKESGQ